MGRPIKSREFLGANATHQIQSTTWGSKDTGATAGYLTAQNSPRRFRSATINGTSLTTFVNGPGNLVSGTSYVKVFPEGSYPTTYARGFATLKAVGNANIVSGGTGYKVGDFLLLVGGTKASAANIQVAAVSGNANVITALSSPINYGYGQQAYSILPTNINAITTSNVTGNGTGAIVSFNFGVDTANVSNGGAGYTAATYVVKHATVAPAFANLAVAGGAVTPTANLVVTNPGVVNVNPVVIVEGDNAVDTEYVRTITSMNYVNTFQGNQYRWLPKGATPQTDYPTLAVKTAFLDTL